MNLSHQEVWRAIDRLAKNKDMSVSGLAIKAGLDPTIFNPSKRTGKEGRKRWPSTKSISKILEATKTAPIEFIALADENPHRIPSVMIPLLGMAQAGGKGHFNDEGLPAGDGWDSVEFPGALDDKTYALEVCDNAMAPTYRDGDRLIVSPTANRRRGDGIVLRTVKGELMVKELRRATASTIEVSSPGLQQDECVLDIQDISFIARVLWVSQ